MFCLQINPETLELKLVPNSTAALISEASPYRGLSNPRYLSPESLLNKEQITFGEDIWSVGMVLAEIFTGFRPHFDNPELCSEADFTAYHQQCEGVPRYNKKITTVLDFGRYRGRGTILEHVGVFINLATCANPKLRPSARELHRNFSMLL